MSAEIAVPNLEEARRTAAHVREVLTAKGLRFIGGPSPHAVEKLSFRGSSYELSVDIFCGSGYITVRASAPILVPQAAIPAVLNELNKRSLEHPFGGFELNDAGKVVFKSGMSVPPLPSGDYLHEVVMWSVSEVDSLAPALAEIVRTNS